VSINVGPLRDGSHQCDLNDVTDDKEFDVALAKETGFTYNAVENPCRHDPCKNNGTCQAGFTSERFRCICPVGIVGKKCDTEGFSLQPVGCYKDKRNDRALPQLYHTLRGSIQWNAPRRGLDLVVKQCAEKANEIGYEYFGVQKYGECYGKGMKYAKHGESEQMCDNKTKSLCCYMFDNRTGHKVGGPSTNFVYRLTFK